MNEATHDQDALKRAVGEAAAALVEDGMVVGLGTGSTARFMVEALGRRVRREGLRMVGIPTSERTAAQARDEGIALAGFDTHPVIDLTLDGADEIDGALSLIKGLGGALLREKIVAAASRRLVIIADAGKLVTRLALRAPVPVEVVRFGWQSTARRLGELGARPELRGQDDGAPFVTDGGNLILDCRFDGLEDAAATERAIGAVVGVVESGLFVARAECALIADADGVRRIVPGADGR